MTFAPVNTFSSYLPPEFYLPGDERDNDFISKRERLTSDILNIKENANYEEKELLTAQQWFSQTVSGAIITSYGYRTTFDLVALNGGAIGSGTTTITLTTTTQPPLIQFDNSIIPTHLYGAATVSGPIYIGFPSDSIIIDFDNTTPSAQEINITNNYGSNLTQCYLVFEYLKT
jgi:hypothetical protein